MDDSSAGRPTYLIFGLGYTPIAVALASLTLPSVHMSEALASACVFGGATSCALIGLTAACAVEPAQARCPRVGAAAVAAALVLVAATTHWAGWLGAALVDGALVAAGWAAGSAIGRKVEDPGHLLPACAVVACADLVSTLSPSGPTHAIATDPRILPLVAISFPVPGTAAFAPALGVGDLVFVALLLAAAVRHRLPYARTAGLCALGIATAGATSAWLGIAVPALVPVSAAVVLGLKPVRTLRARDRRVAQVAIALAMGLATATMAARLLA